jgi:tight adherence protein C
MFQPMHLVLFAGCGAGLLAVAGAVLLAGEAGQHDLSRRVRQVTDPALAGEASPARSSGHFLLGAVRKLGETLQDLPPFSGKGTADLERAAQAAGLNPRRAVPAVIGGKVLLMLTCPILAYLLGSILEISSSKRLLMVAVGVGVGMLSPDWVLGYVRRAHAKALQRGLPDALDLMVVCAEAGLGLESAVDRIATEMRSFNPQVGLEFYTLSQELRLSADRRTALTRMAERTGLESYQRLTSTLSQTLHYGTPLGKALRILSAEMRNERMIRIEEKAAKLPSLLTLPMMLFIFPCQFIVLAGPAVISVMNSLGR